MSNVHTPKTRIYSMTIAGNLHDVARCVNSLGWPDFLISAECTGGSSIALLRFPADWPFDNLGPLMAVKSNPD